MEWGDATHTGLLREGNQDNYAVDPRLGLWVVADGMGGHAGGEMASAIAVTAVVRAVRGGVDLEAAIADAHRQVRAARQVDRPDMGSTLVAAQLDGARYRIAWVGDSRGYLWNGRLSRLTRDHSMVQQMVDAGHLSPAEAEHHPQRNVITQAIGVGEAPPRVGVKEGQLYRGDWLLLCSDGLCGEIDDEGIARVLATDGDPAQDRVDRLVGAALDAGGSDNVTVLLLSAPPAAAARPVTGDHPVAPATPTVRMPSAGRPSGIRRRRSFIYGIAGGTLLLLALGLAFWSFAGRQEAVPEPDEEPRVGDMTRTPENNGSPDEPGRPPPD